MPRVELTVSPLLPATILGGEFVKIMTDAFDIILVEVGILRVNESVN